MIRLLIVDDEEITRDSLKDYVNWAEMGINSVFTARNGLEALELAKQFEPDILLTDVRMPKMDGIKLASKIKELYHDCRIIFLSGYADKEYLKQAINLNAVSYIEKPLNINEITSVVRSAILQCSEDAKKKAEAVILKDRIAESLLLVRQEIALKLIKGHMDVLELAEKYTDIFPVISNNTFYTTVNIKINWNRQTNNRAIDSIKSLIINALSGFTPGNSIQSLYSFYDNRNIVYIIMESPASSKQNMTDTAGQLQNKLLELSEGTFSISAGIGPTVNRSEDLHKSYNSAVFAADMQFYLGTNKIFASSMVNTCNYEFDKNILGTFRDYLKKDRKDKASDLVIKITDDAMQAKDVNIDYIKNIFFNLFLVLFEVALDREFISPFGDREKGYIWQEINSANTLSELSEYILSNIESIFSRTGEKDAASGKLHEVMQYIKRNYNDKDLSIQSIADHLYLSKAYLCTFFKRNTGKTLNDYFTEIRMEKAKELLKDSRTKVYEVASNIGLTDPNYFSILFKKHTGYTPSEFRERY